MSAPWDCPLSVQLIAIADSNGDSMSARQISQLYDGAEMVQKLYTAANDYFHATHPASQRVCADRLRETLAQARGQ